MAAGILGIGFMLILGTFPVGMHFTAKATERSIGSVASDEAFAKIQLYGLDHNKLKDKRQDSIDNSSDGFLMLFDGDNSAERARDTSLELEDHFYPSVPESTYTNNIDNKPRYFWRALCGQVNSPDSKTPLIQITVLVSRKSTHDSTFTNLTGSWSDNSLDDDWPAPVDLDVSYNASRTDQLKLDTASDDEFINENDTIIDARTGRMYRITEKLKGSGSNFDIIQLDRQWDSTHFGLDPDKQGEDDSDYEPKIIWVVPGSDQDGKSPLVAIYQKIIRIN